MEEVDISEWKYLQEYDFWGFVFEKINFKILL